ncbi:dihydrofolate reductase, partial [Aerococcus urinae]
MIWAQDRNGILGAGGNMLWHVPADFKHFKATTMSH